MTNVRKSRFTGKNADKNKKSIVEAVIENTRDSIRWPWTIMLGFAMVKAVSTIYDKYAHEFFLDTVQQDPFPFVIFLTCFIPTFLRFYVGNNRLVEVYYFNATQVLQLDKHCKVTYTILPRRKRLLDQLGLIFHAVLFVFLGLSLTTPIRFFKVMYLLILLNTLWLFLTYLVDANIKQGVEKIAKSSKSHNARAAAKRYLAFVAQDTYIFKAPYIWMILNFCTLIALTPFVLSPYIDSATLGMKEFLGLSTFEVLVCFTCISFANSILDVALTYRFYVPRLNILVHKMTI